MQTEFRLEWNNALAASLGIDKWWAVEALAVEERVAPAIEWG